MVKVKTIQRMGHSSPRRDSFIARLRACTESRDIDEGSHIHREISCHGFLYKDLLLGAMLVHFYARCGSLDASQHVFDTLLNRNVVGWNALMTGYAKSVGHGMNVLKCFDQMKQEGICPDAISCVCTLKACGSIRNVEKGREIHVGIIGNASLEKKNSILGSALMDMYAKCGILNKAKHVFDELYVWDVVSWTTLMSTYVAHGYGEEALMFFEHMKLQGICPDEVTFVCALKACRNMGNINKGCEIHIELERKGLLRNNLILASSLVDMYAKCGALSKAKHVFDELHNRNLVLWNALMTGYTEHGFSEETLECMKTMQCEGIRPDLVSFICGLKACGNIGAIDKGGELHAEVARCGLLERDPTINCALVDMYAKCGFLERAHEVFHTLILPQDVVLWTALIAGYAENGFAVEALQCFEKMQKCGVSPNALTFMYSLRACCDSGAMDKGYQMHAEIERNGLLGREMALNHNLIAMYAKCGMLTVAQHIFDKLLVRDLVVWTPLIIGYAQIGQSQNVFHIFDQMQEEGIKPDAITFVSILNACSRTFSSEKSHTYFEAMSKRYGIIPTVEHHCCMVDLHSRAGQLDEAIEIIRKMPISPNLGVWHAFLSACTNWGNAFLGKHAFEHARSLDNKDAATFVLMSHIQEMEIQAQRARS